MSKIVTYSDESAVDVSIRAFGHVEGLVSFCVANGLAVDSVDGSGGSEHAVDDTLALELRAKRPLFPVKPEKVEEQVIIQSGQNLVDLSIQEMGSIEGMVALMKLNGFSFSSVPTAGETLKVNSSDVVNLNARAFYKNRRHHVNTGDDTSELPTNARLLEDGFFRLLEDGSYRLLE